MSDGGLGAGPDREPAVGNGPPSTTDSMRPLWWVAALAIAADAAFLAHWSWPPYLEAREGTVLLLAGVTVAVLVAQLLAFAVARRQGRPDRGTWAIATRPAGGSPGRHAPRGGPLDPGAVPPGHRAAAGGRGRPAEAHPAGHHPRPPGRGEHGGPRPARSVGTSDVVRRPAGPDGRARGHPRRPYPGALRPALAAAAADRRRRSTCGSTWRRCCPWC